MRMLGLTWPNHLSFHLDQLHDNEHDIRLFIQLHISEPDSPCLGQKRVISNQVLKILPKTTRQTPQPVFGTHRDALNPS